MHLMMTPTQVFLALLLVSGPGLAAFVFEDADTPGVDFGDVQDDARIVTMDESNDSGTIRVAVITGTAIGNLGITASSANVDYFGLQFESAEGKIYLTSNLIDYEALVDANLQNRALFYVEDSSDNTRTMMALNVKNLDDENPTITSSGSCEMAENTDITLANSQCEFQVSDRDGWLNQMDFSEIEGDRDAATRFAFGFRDAPSDTTYTATAYLYLKGDQLDYEQVTLYTFNLLAQDEGNNPTIPPKVPVIVTVGDEPDMPPVWDSSFRSAMSIDEKEQQTLTVSAKDGDYGINNNISYAIADESGFISIDATTGVITIAPIDRDAGNDQVVFDVTAIEVEDPDSFLTNSITLIINDKDDQIPEITATGAVDKAIVIEIDEGATDIDLPMYANDRDFGQNAIYTAELQSDQDLSSTIVIIPGRGYENTSLALTILNPAKLDFEDPDWRTITMKLVTTGSETPTNTDYLDITINLNDLNDEYPIFSPDAYTATVREDVPVETLIKMIQATDKDAVDKDVKHELLGTMANDILVIEEFGGNVTTKKDDAFDYEKQSEVVVQIRASDLASHQTTAQLTITVIDVNDEDPRMVVSSAISVMENQEDGFEIPTSITASDEDTTADLTFSIDWDLSYALKNGQKLTEDQFAEIHCINIETIPGDSNHVASAKLTIKETQPGNTPDYEVFDSLYLQLVVTDQNTENLDKKTGTDSAIVIITIEDDNDNPPVFADGTETATRQVTENADNGTLITSVQATDDDAGTTLIYFIESADDGTTPNWVSIDSGTGSISVNLPENQSIDCDDPVIDSLTYIVTATDGKYEANATITIKINDQNDNVPTLGNQEGSITEDNGHTGESSPDDPLIISLDPQDADRDQPNNVVLCVFATSTPPEVTSRFMVSSDNEISVNLTNGATLDREEYPTFTFSLNCYDDPARQGPISNNVYPSPTVTITLKDVNDNMPTITNSKITGLSENNSGDVSTALQGEDKDAGDNSLIDFVEVKTIERFLDQEHTRTAEVPQDLFTLATVDNQRGVLTISPDNLMGYYGYLVLTITLTDKGTEPLSQDVPVELEVLKYNFKEPAFEFPVDGNTYYLKSSQTPNAALRLWNDEETLQDLEATDQQDDKYSISFVIVEDSSEEGLFVARTQTNTKAQLQMTNGEAKEQKYTITIMATIQKTGDSLAGAAQPGEAAYSKNCTIGIVFFDADSTDPVFATAKDSATFDENDDEAQFQVPEATYPNVTNSDITDNLPVYYLLREGDASLFKVDGSTGIVSLVQALDYETQTSYTLVIQSSNSQNIKPAAVDQTKFELTINVRDLNDNPPVFDSKSYTTTFDITSGSSAPVIATVSATDVDTTSTGKLRFSIESIVASLTSINIPNAFSIGTSTGDITPTFTPSNSMEGVSFTITVIVRDEDDDDEHLDRATVIVYLVTQQNIMGFKFENDFDTVNRLKDDIANILNAQFEANHYVTNVATPKSESTADDATAVTTANVYFVNTDTKKPVDATEIYKEVTNANIFKQLKQSFLEKGLYLLSFTSETNTNENLEDMLKAWLIGVSVVLGSLCIILLVAFILKTRALNQRINKLSNTKFGSQESGLNRTGVATAPTTNKHAVEGSNPVYNNEVNPHDIDRRSVTSGDSDLIGVEDDEKFDYDNVKVVE